MRNVAKLTIGSRVRFDGDVHVVEVFAGSTVRLRTVRGTLVAVSMTQLVNAPDFKVLEEDDEDDEDDLAPYGLAEKYRQETYILLGHIREVITGYKSGYAETALSGEPKEPYDPELTSLTKRVQAKASELGIGERTLHRYKSDYLERGVAGLIDWRRIQTVSFMDSVDERLIKAIDMAIEQHKEKSNVTRGKLRRVVKNILKAEHGEGVVELKSTPTFNKILAERAKGKMLFGSAKTRRGYASRPPTPFRRIYATRPGEYVVLDVTDLDAFAMDPLSLEWIPVKLAMAIDLYSRSILARRFIHQDKQVDAALLLYDMLRPKAFHPHLPDSARWGNTYVGVPENIIINLSETDTPEGVAAIPIVKPENIIIDRGMIFMSIGFQNGCHYLGVNIQPARPRTGTDKTYIERMFGTIGTMFTQYLPGYKGPDVYSRGTVANVEEDAFNFIDELEVYFDDWTASFWQNRPHPSLFSDDAPGIRFSPNELYEEGIAKAGFLYVPKDANLYYELLPTAWRTVKEEGISFENLTYDGKVLNAYRKQTSPYHGEYPGK